ncbi:UDP-3-O-acyl-N-acetylglucosamine deacetylase [Parvibaculum sp.]|uniref:UDP-3-O-acyl-N-acetylglucosamine deacetylase n=1 Tax=Parvibaculum sp. TaxID=2024848 RepID=UPI00349FEAAD
MTSPSTFNMRQGTVRQPASFAGIGLHTGRHTQVTVMPAPAGQGIRFRRTDKGGKGAELQADWRHCVDFPRCTMMQAPGGAKFQTIEHLMAALFALEIDNATVLMDGQEVPIMDGSAAPLVEAIAAAGRAEQDAPRQFRKIERALTVTDNRISLSVEPADRFIIDYTLELPYWGTQHWAGEVTPESFRRDICYARTYGILSVIWPALILGKLRLIPLVRGASLGNALLMYKDRVLNKGGLKSPDEFLRHRIIDLVGDLALGGGPLIGKVTAFCSNHKHNRALLRAIEAEKTAELRAS